MHQFQDFWYFMDNNFASWVDYQLGWFITNMEAIKGKLLNGALQFILERSKNQPGLLPRNDGNPYQTQKTMEHQNSNCNQTKQRMTSKSATQHAGAPPPAAHFSNRGQQPTKLWGDAPSLPTSASVLTPLPPDPHHFPGQPSATKRNPGLLPPPPAVQRTTNGAKKQFPLAYTLAPAPELKDGPPIDHVSWAQPSS